MNLRITTQNSCLKVRKTDKNYSFNRICQKLFKFSLFWTLKNIAKIYKFWNVRKSYFSADAANVHQSNQNVGLLEMCVKSIEMYVSGKF